MFHNIIDIESLNSMIEGQLQVWPLASGNFGHLREIKRKGIPIGSFDCHVQCNPARIVSTGAKVDKDAIASRRCFLCASNRPKEQVVFELLDGWDFLINPYPILPMHFTVPSKNHVPQCKIPYDLAAMAEKAPDLVFFYNGAHAGASAPDHLHAQAVLSSELPLLRLVEEFHHYSQSGFKFSEDFGKDLPFQFISAIISPDAEGMRMMRKINMAFGIDSRSGIADHGLINAYFWMGKSGLLRAVIIPRRQHRPTCYDAEGDKKYLISPGCIDMAGIIVCPRPEDFEKMDSEKAREIYSEVAFAEKLPKEIKEFFLK